MRSRRKLAYDEMVDTPLDKLLEIWLGRLTQEPGALQRNCKGTGTEQGCARVLEELGQNHPAPDHLLDAFRATFNGLVSFIRANHIVSIPSDVRPNCGGDAAVHAGHDLCVDGTRVHLRSHATEAYFK